MTVCDQYKPSITHRRNSIKSVRHSWALTQPGNHISSRRQEPGELSARVTGACAGVAARRKAAVRRGKQRRTCSRQRVLLSTGTWLR